MVRTTTNKLDERSYCSSYLFFSLFFIFLFFFVFFPGSSRGRIVLSTDSSIVRFRSDLENASIDVFSKIRNLVQRMRGPTLDTNLRVPSSGAGTKTKVE
jgi:hypothetical protein